jgi:hypothetical protein
MVAMPSTKPAAMASSAVYALPLYASGSVIFSPLLCFTDAIKMLLIWSVLTY